MKVLFDSSIFIAAFVESHPKHEVALEYLLKAKNKEFGLIVSAHTILEVYSVLTGAPFKPKITPQTANRLIKNNIKKFSKVVHLSGREYYNLVIKMSDNQLEGGIVYDALIVECAINSKADEIVTINSKDFYRLTRDTSIKVITI